MDIADIAAVALKLGYPSLRDKQKEGILRFLEGRDVFIYLPTGSGKSLCFHSLPLAFDLMRSNTEPSCIAVIISPLNALIKDQIASLSGKGLRSVHVASGLAESDDQLAEKVHAGDFQYVFFSPEALLGDESWRDMLQTSVYQENVIAIVIDEAHLVTKW